MMSGTLIMLIGAMAMGGLLEQSRVLSVIIEALMRHVRGALGLILSTIAACYATLGVTGNMMLAIILPGKTFKPVFDRMGIAPEVLSRTLEDAGTLGSVLVPWGIPALFLWSIGTPPPSPHPSAPPHQPRTPHTPAPQ